MKHRLMTKAEKERILAVLEGQHQAIDILLAELIMKDRDFRPSQSTIWPAVVRSYDLIRELRSETKDE